jgi:uncharacterized protein
MPLAMPTETRTLDPALAERERVLRILRAEEPRLRVRGIRHLSLFGSLARGDAAPESDVDLLIETDPQGHLSLFDVVELQEQLEALLGRPTHFAFSSAMRPWLRDDILKEAISIW